MPKKMLGNLLEHYDVDYDLDSVQGDRGWMDRQVKPLLT
jgi:hypothetical protein